MLYGTEHPKFTENPSKAIYSSCGSPNHKESKASQSNSVLSLRQHCVSEISTAASSLVCYYSYTLFACDSEMMMMIVAIVVIIIIIINYIIILYNTYIITLLLL